MLGFIGFIMICTGLFFIWNLGIGLVGCVVALIASVVVGYVAEAAVPGERMPGGFVAAIGAALVGSWVGVYVLGSFGPSLFGFPLITSTIGAALIVGIVTYISRAWVGEKIEPRVFETAGMITYNLTTPTSRNR